MARLEAAAGRALQPFRKLFLIAALYDGVLGVLFFFLHGPIFNILGILLPNNTSYIHLTAGFVWVQGVAYWFVSRNMLRNADIVKMGVLYKGIYIAVAVYYLLRGELPAAIFGWFALFDVVFLVLFLAFLRRVGTLDQAAERAER